MTTTAPNLVPLPADRANVRAIYVIDGKNPNNNLRLAASTPQGTIDAVMTGRRVKGWAPVLMADVAPDAPVVAPAFTLAAALDEVEMVGVGVDRQPAAQPLSAPALAGVTHPWDQPVEAAQAEVERTSLPVVTARQAPVVRSWAVETVDIAGADRAAADETTCTRLGIALPPAFFALGTTLVDIGVDNARKARESFEALPPASEACAALAAEVDAEDRRSVAAGLSDLTLSPRGELARGSDGATRREPFSLGLEADAARQLQSTLRAKLGIGGDPGVVTGLEFPDADVVACAANTWNRYTALLKRKEGSGAERKQVSLLTRMVEQPEQDGKPQPRRQQVFAVVSEKYAECDAGKIATACGGLVRDIDAIAMREGKTPDVRAEIIYDRKRTSIDLLTHTTIQPDAQVVGDVFRVGLRVRSDDTGGGSLTVRSVAFRVACRNYTVVSADGSITRIRHIGDPARLLERLQEALQASSGALAAFAVQWGKACGRDAARDLLRGLETERKRRDELGALVDTLLASERSTGWTAQQGAVLDGIYRSILTTHDLAPVKAIEDEVIALRRAYHDPVNIGGATAFSPAAINNGLTRWAQDRGRHTADTAEILAGQIVSGDEVLSWIGAPARA